MNHFYYIKHHTPFITPYTNRTTPCSFRYSSLPLWPN